MIRPVSTKSKVRQMIRANPFRPIALCMKDGDRLLIEHPENIAFDPSDDDSAGRSAEFYVITQQLRVFSNFSAVISIAVIDRAEG